MEFETVTPPGTARRPILQARAVPGESIGPKMEINILLLFFNQFDKLLKDNLHTQFLSLKSLDYE